MEPDSVQGWAKRKLAGRTKKMAYAAREAKGDAKLVDEAAEKIKAGKGDRKLMRLAKKVDPEHNPPSWVTDEAKWERAKKAVEPRWQDYDEPYAVVATVYQSMGGKTK